MAYHYFCKLRNVWACTCIKNCSRRMSKKIVVTCLGMGTGVGGEIIFTVYFLMVSDGQATQYICAYLFNKKFKLMKIRESCGWRSPASFDRLGGQQEGLKVLSAHKFPLLVDPHTCSHPEMPSSHEGLWLQSLSVHYWRALFSTVLGI